MNNDFDTILDECIDRIIRGEDIGACLARYPGYAERLRSSLLAVFKTIDAYAVVPSPDAKKAARKRFNAALEDLARRREEKRSRFGWFQGRPWVWATATAVLIIALVTYFGVRPNLFPGEPAPQVSPGPTTATTTGLPTSPPPSLVATVPQPSPDGKFVFLISDDVNAISDFNSLNVSIAKIGLLRSGDADELIEFTPEQSEVDLTLLQGDRTQEIWRGDIPEGEYTNVTLEVSDVRGILKETGEEIEIKLPSQKLHVSKRFQVSADVLTEFTYDLTVVAAGNAQSGIKYILKPQVDQSGADHKAVEPPGQSKKDDLKNTSPE